MEKLVVLSGLLLALSATVWGVSIGSTAGTDLVLTSDDAGHYNATSEKSLEFKPEENYMNLLCNMKRNLHDRNAILMSPWSTRHPPTSTSCVVGVESTSYQNYRFVVTFKKMEMSSATSGTCARSRLDLFNGKSVSVTNLISEPSGLCGGKTNRESYSTTGNFLTMRYTTNNLQSGSAEYFIAVITPYHYGTCRHDEFKCANARCVHNNMLCDSYDNCGDDSDEKSCAKLALSIAAIVGIVVGAVVLIVIFIAVCVCCNICCCACSAYEKI